MLKKSILLVLIISITFASFVNYVSMRCPLQQYARSNAVQVVEVLDSAFSPNCSISTNLTIVGPETNYTITTPDCYSSGENFFNYTINATGIFTLTPIVQGAANNETCKLVVIDARKNNVPDSNYISILLVFIICAIIYARKS